MTLLDAVISALDALRLHKLRSALTMLGIIIGVAAVIAMVAVGGGAREQVVAQIRSLGANLLIISPGNVTQGGVRLGSGAASTLTDEDSAAIMKEVPGVQVTAPYMRGNAQLIASGMNWATGVFGIDLGWFEAREWDVDSGRVFEPEEIARGAQVALIGQTVARTLYGGIDPVAGSSTGARTGGGASAACAAGAIGSTPAARTDAPTTWRTAPATPRAVHRSTLLRTALGRSRASRSTSANRTTAR